MIGILVPVLFAPGQLDLVVDEIRSNQDVLAYDISVSLPETGALIQASTGIRFLVVGGEGPLILDFDSVFTIDSVTSGDRSIAARLAGERLEVLHWGDPGDTLDLTIYYHGSPADGLFIQDNVHGERSAFADNWPNRAHHWFPSEDHPSDKAFATFAVEAPGGWSVVANGEFVGREETQNGRAIWRWQTTRQIPVYTMVIGAGEFTVTEMGTVDGKPQSLWTFRQDSAFAASGPLARVVDIAQRLTDLIGPFPYAKLAHVESSTRFGGMENSSAIFYAEGAYEGRRMGESVVAHEIAHQWFGDAVTEYDWHHIWLSEGFASYFGPLYYELAGEDSTFRAAIQMNKRVYMESDVVNRPVIDPAVESLFDLLNHNNYQKGSLILHMLRAEIGDSAFFSGVRRFYSEYRDSTVLSADLMAIMEDEAGRSLRWFFSQWLLQPGYPQIEVNWRYEGQDVYVSVTQTQSGDWGRYRFTLPIALEYEDGNTARAYVQVRRRENTFRLPSPRARPARVIFDPEGTLLAQIRETGNP